MVVHLDKTDPVLAWIHLTLSQGSLKKSESVKFCVGLIQTLECCDVDTTMIILVDGNFGCIVSDIRDICHMVMMTVVWWSVIFPNLYVAMTCS